MQINRFSRGMSDYQLKMAFIMPTMILLILMNIFPLLWSLYLSFHRYKVSIPTAPPKYIGLRNYSQLFTDPEIWGYFRTTAYFVILAVTAQFFIGFGLAILLNRKFPAKGLVTTLLLLPMMLSPAVVGLFWRFILASDNSGLLNFILSPLLKLPFINSPPIGWTTDPKIAMLAVVIVDTWMWSPFMMLIALAGLSAVPKYLYEAADVDRASAWFKISLDYTTFSVSTSPYSSLVPNYGCFQMFDIVYVLTRRGGPGAATETVSMNLYKLAFKNYNTGKACAMAYILLIIIVALSNIYVKYLNRVKGET